MQLPSTLTDEVLRVINEVVDNLAPGFAFGYYDVDDLKQEGRMEAMDALSRFDPNRGTSLKTFLHRHVRNRYINLKRNKYLRPIPKNIDEKRAEKLNRKNTIKRSLIDTVDISSIDNSDNKDPDLIEDLSNQEIFKLIDIHLPVEYRIDYRCMIENAAVPKHRRVKVIKIIKGIIDEHYREKKRKIE